MSDTVTSARSPVAAFADGSIIDALGGLIGLGGAEFRLPLLIGAFRFAALQAMHELNVVERSTALGIVQSAHCGGRNRTRRRTPYYLASLILR